MEDEEIYEAPDTSKSEHVASVSELMKRFDRKSKIIKMAPDDRYMNKNVQSMKPAMKTKPSFMRGVSPGSGLPDLPTKIGQLKKVNKPLIPGGPIVALNPIVADSIQTQEAVSSTADNTVQSQIRAVSNRRSPDRSTMYPPKRQTSSESEMNNNINNDASSEQNLNGFRLRQLPLAPCEQPPAKPSHLDILLYQWQGDDPEEIYDDIAVDDSDFPQVRHSVITREVSKKGESNSRTISLIPDMTEEDEKRELARKSHAHALETMPVGDEDGDQELYDDVLGAEDDQQIYQAID